MRFERTELRSCSILVRPVAIPCPGHHEHLPNIWLQLADQRQRTRKVQLNNDPRRIIQRTGRRTVRIEHEWGLVEYNVAVLSGEFERKISHRDHEIEPLRLVFAFQKVSK